MVDSDRDDLQITIEETAPSSSSDESDSEELVQLKQRVAVLKRNIDKLRAQQKLSDDSEDNAGPSPTSPAKSKKNSMKRVKISPPDRNFVNKKTQTENCTYCMKLNHTYRECRLRASHIQGRGRPFNGHGQNRNLYPRY